jgi:SAM-dependent methyltransferase
MISFTCNLCGRSNVVEHFASEAATCPCGSNVRLRALAHLLSMELFGRSLILSRAPQIRSIQALGISDKDCLANALAGQFTYTNSFYDQEPRVDLNGRNARYDGQFDFIIAGETLEHVAPPVVDALREIHRLLKPNGFLGLTIYCNPQDKMREHFPNLRDWRIVRMPGGFVVLNRLESGQYEVHDNLIFHGDLASDSGGGATLELREYGVGALRAQLLEAGFPELVFQDQDIPAYGVIFDHDVSLPLLARKAPFTLDAAARAGWADGWLALQAQLAGERERRAHLEEQIRLATGSRWLRLGRRLGLGPRF